MDLKVPKTYLFYGLFSSFHTFLETDYLKIGFILIFWSIWKYFSKNIKMKQERIKKTDRIYRQCLQNPSKIYDFLSKDSDLCFFQKFLLNHFLRVFYLIFTLWTFYASQYCLKEL